MGVRNKEYITLPEFLSYKDRAEGYDGYVIGLGYAFTDAIPYSQFNPYANRYEPSYCPTITQQNMAVDSANIIDSYGDNMQLLQERIVQVDGDKIYVHWGFGEVEEFPAEGTKIGIKTDSTSELVIEVEHKSILRQEAKRKEMSLSDAYVAYDLSSVNATLRGTIFVSGGIGAFADLRGNLPHNELMWRQKNGKWTMTSKIRNNYVYRRSYEMAAKRAQPYRTVGKAAGVAGLGLIGVDIAASGEVRPSHIVNSVVMWVGVFGGPAGGIISGLWFIADISTGIITGESLSERLDNWSGNLIEFEPLIDLSTPHIPSRETNIEDRYIQRPDTLYYHLKRPLIDKPKFDNKPFNWDDYGKK